MYARARKGIGYLPQEPSIFRGLTVEQNIMAILETLDLDAAGRRARCKELLAELNLTSLGVIAGLHAVGRRAAARRNHASARHLAASFCCSTSRSPGIDPIAITDIQKIIFHLKDRGIGVLITDHNVRETLRITDRAYIVHDGGHFPQRDARGAGGRRRSAAHLSRHGVPSRLKTKN